MGKFNRFWKDTGVEIDTKYILELAEDLKQFYRDFGKQCEEEDKFYNQEFDVYPAMDLAGYSVHRPASARIAIDDASAQLDTSSIQMEVPDRTNRIEDKDKAVKLQKFYHGCWNRILEDDDTFLNRICKDGFRYGVAFPKVMYDREVWGDAPKQEKKESDDAYAARMDEWRQENRHYFPIKIDLCHPITVFPDPTIISSPSKGAKFVMEIYKRKVAAVASEFPDWSKGGHGLNDEVEWIEYWDTKGYSYICDGKAVVEYTEHSYGFLPYEIIDFGIGANSADGKPEKRWKGLLNSVHSDLVGEAQFITLVMRILEANACGSKDFIAESVEAEAKLAKVIASYQQGPGAHNEIPHGIKIEQPKFPEMPQGVFEIIGILKDDSERATVAKVARGERPSGAASGYMVAVLAGMARLKYGPAMQSLKQGIKKMNRDMAMLVEAFMPNGITVWGKLGTESFDIVVKKDDIDGYYINDVKISAVTPEEQDRLQSMGIQLHNAGLLSMDTVQQRFLGVEDPTEEFRKILRERVLESPEVIAFIIQAVQGSEQFQQQTAALVGTGGEPPNLGNQGNLPPPQAMLRGRSNVPTPPVKPGSMAEMDLTRRQIQHGQGAQGQMQPVGDSFGSR